MKKMMLLAVAAVALIASPAAAQYDGDTLVLSDSSIAAGDSVDVSCTGLEPGVAYSVLFDSDEVGSGNVDDGGIAAGSFTTASDTPPGTYELAVMTDSGGCTGTIEVLGADVENPGNPGTPGTPGTPGFVDGSNNGGSNATQAGNVGSGTLPRTGASDGIRTSAMVGAGLLALGGMVTLAVRRKATV